MLTSHLHPVLCTKNRPRVYIASLYLSSCLCSSSEGGSVEGNLDYDPYLTNDSGITEDEPVTLEEGLLYVTKVSTQSTCITCLHGYTSELIVSCK